ncbi:hypothetical protein TNIN_424832 [Trichonephila inaurata madagascariensis]|uniref:Uncharacterized protein n=1 Tax=Trichonephila inaurata madagascariensis TaxID=2747483 RepID=A0A8X7BWL2_9ARAC|nr:hypothetical protein TNIN_424832 [Trichonephila inaurata madagascariensis]
MLELALFQWEKSRQPIVNRVPSAKALINPTVQPAGPPPTFTEVTPSSLQPQVPSSSPVVERQVREPSSSTQGTYSSRPPTSCPPTTSQDPLSLAYTFAQVNDPEVRVMFQVIQKFITISKQNKPRV